MKVNKLMSALGASALALALVAGVTATPAMAVEVGSGIKFTKTINMTNAAGATVPTARYTYGITPGSAVAATANTPEIKAGVGTPTIGSAEFTYTDTIPGNKLVTEDVTVNFDAVTFLTTGIYRYVITETDPVVAGLATSEDDNTIYLDVYVTNGDTGLEVTYYQMTTSANAPTYDQGTKNPNYGSTKFTGDVDAYTTYQLTVTKNVEGTMADMTQKFSIDVDFTDLSEGTKVKVDGVQTADGASADGALSVNKSLGDDESMTITGVPADAVYTVVENIAKTEGYTTTATVQRGTGTATTANVTVADTTQTVAQQTMGENDNTVVVTNTKNAVNPTGIILNVAPYALMVVIALAGVVVFLRKRVED